MCLLEWFRSVENFPNPIADNCPIEKLVRNVNMRLIRILHYEYLQVSENQRLKFFQLIFPDLISSWNAGGHMSTHWFPSSQVNKSQRPRTLREWSQQARYLLKLVTAEICCSDLATCSEPLIRRKAAANCSGAPFCTHGRQLDENLWVRTPSNWVIQWRLSDMK